MLGDSCDLFRNRKVYFSSALSKRRNLRPGTGRFVVFLSIRMNARLNADVFTWRFVHANLMGIAHANLIRRISNEKQFAVEHQLSALDPLAYVSPGG